MPVDRSGMSARQGRLKAENYSLFPYANCPLPLSGVLGRQFAPC